MVSAGERPPVGAGVVCALVGFTSSFAVVLAGLRAVGATPQQAASGLLAACAVQGVAMATLSVRHRMPITLAWSTPGAALLASTSAVAGGWSAAVGAFIVTGALIVATGLIPGLERAVAAIPTPIAQAMLAGVLLPLCMAPVSAIAHDPVAIAPIVLAWLLLMRWAPRWSVPGAFAMAVIVIVGHHVSSGTRVRTADWIPHLSIANPTWNAAGIVGISLPLYIVTMAAQNIPGMAIMNGFGYRVPWRESMATTGGATIAGAFAGVPALNLAAISAALAAGPQVHRNPACRWPAGVSAGVTYVALAAISTGIVAVITDSPNSVVPTVAGLALIATLGSSLVAAVRSDDEVPSQRHGYHNVCGRRIRNNNCRDRIRDVGVGRRNQCLACT